ncbi:hypothetical protein BESB_012790 [Besnoitia besnoiti]|uniref:Uncharacterized protein n=1 Tax=Besnoitia besnoiti TaxID=94643 RepID=A0A2A9MAM2_BESBE|nr:hypothetical protein BESB_012790 [Besnoitia besnoiti]PFH32667.1 hypothetical protein BESB_012790 [Besnoitia besnoiti]
MAVSLPLHIFRFYGELGAVHGQMTARIVRGEFAVLSPQTTETFATGFRVAQALNVLFIRHRLAIQLDLRTLSSAQTHAAREANWLHLIAPLRRLGVFMDAADAASVAHGDKEILQKILTELYQQHRRWLSKVNRELSANRKNKRSYAGVPTEGYAARLAAHRKRSLTAPRTCKVFAPRRQHRDRTEGLNDDEREQQLPQARAVLKEAEGETPSHNRGFGESVPGAAWFEEHAREVPVTLRGSRQKSQSSQRHRRQGSSGETVEIGRRGASKRSDGNTTDAQRELETRVDALSPSAEELYPQPVSRIPRPRRRHDSAVSSFLCSPSGASSVAPATSFVTPSTSFAVLEGVDSAPSALEERTGLEGAVAMPLWNLGAREHAGRRPCASSPTRAKACAACVATSSSRLSSPPATTLTSALPAPHDPSSSSWSAAVAVQAPLATNSAGRFGSPAQGLELGPPSQGPPPASDLPQLPQSRGVPWMAPAGRRPLVLSSEPPSQAPPSPHRERHGKCPRAASSPSACWSPPVLPQSHARGHERSETPLLTPPNANAPSQSCASRSDSGSPRPELDVSRDAAQRLRTGPKCLTRGWAGTKGQMGATPASAAPHPPAAQRLPMRWLLEIPLKRGQSSPRTDAEVLRGSTSGSRTRRTPSSSSPSLSVLHARTASHSTQHDPTAAAKRRGALPSFRRSCHLSQSPDSPVPPLHTGIDSWGTSTLRRRSLQSPGRRAPSPSSLSAGRSHRGRQACAATERALGCLRSSHLSAAPRSSGLDSSSAVTLELCSFLASSAASPASSSQGRGDLRFQCPVPSAATAVADGAGGGLSVADREAVSGSLPRSGRGTALPPEWRSGDAFTGRQHSHSGAGGSLVSASPRFAHSRASLAAASPRPQHPLQPSPTHPLPPASSLLVSSAPRHGGPFWSSDRRRPRTCEEAFALAAERAFGVTWREAVRAVKTKAKMFEFLRNVFANDQTRFQVGLRLWVEELTPVATESRPECARKRERESASVQCRGASQTADSRHSQEAERRCEAGDVRTSGQGGRSGGRGKERDEARRHAMHPVGKEADTSRKRGVLADLVDALKREPRKLAIVLDIYREGAFFFGMPSLSLGDDVAPTGASSPTSSSLLLVSPSASFSAASALSGLVCEGPERPLPSEVCAHLVRFLRALWSFLRRLSKAFPDGPALPLVSRASGSSDAACAAAAPFPLIDSLARLLTYVIPALPSESATQVHAAPASAASASAENPPAQNRPYAPALRTLRSSSSTKGVSAIPSCETHASSPRTAAASLPVRRCGTPLTHTEQGEATANSGRSRSRAAARKHAESLMELAELAARCLACFAHAEPRRFVREILPVALQADEEAFSLVVHQLLPLWGEEVRRLLNRDESGSAEGESATPHAAEAEDNEGVLERRIRAETRDACHATAECTDREASAEGDASRSADGEGGRRLTKARSEPRLTKRSCLSEGELRETRQTQLQQWTEAGEHLLQFCCSELSVLSFASPTVRGDPTDPRRASDGEPQNWQHAPVSALLNDPLRLHLSLLCATLETLAPAMLNVANPSLGRGPVPKAMAQASVAVDEARRRQKTRRSLIQALTCLASFLKHPRAVVREAATEQLRRLLHACVTATKRTEEKILPRNADLGAALPGRANDPHITPWSHPPREEERFRRPASASLEPCHAHTPAALLPLLWETGVLSWEALEGPISEEAGGPSECRNGLRKRDTLALTRDKGGECRASERGSRPDVRLRQVPLDVFLQLVKDDQAHMRIDMAAVVARALPALAGLEPQKLHPLSGVILVAFVQHPRATPEATLAVLDLLAEIYFRSALSAACASSPPGEVVASDSSADSRVRHRLPQASSHPPSGASSTSAEAADSPALHEPSPGASESPAKQLRGSEGDKKQTPAVHATTPVSEDTSSSASSCDRLLALLLLVLCLSPALRTDAASTWLAAFLSRDVERQMRDSRGGSSARGRGPLVTGEALSAKQTAPPPVSGFRQKGRKGGEQKRPRCAAQVLLAKIEEEERTQENERERKATKAACDCGTPTERREREEIAVRPWGKGMLRTLSGENSMNIPGARDGDSDQHGRREQKQRCRAEAILATLRKLREVCEDSLAEFQAWQADRRSDGTEERQGEEEEEKQKLGSYCGTGEDSVKGQRAGISEGDDRETFEALSQTKCAVLGDSSEDATGSTGDAKREGAHAHQAEATENANEAEQDSPSVSGSTPDPAPAVPHPQREDASALSISLSIPPMDSRDSDALLAPSPPAAWSLGESQAAARRARADLRGAPASLSAGAEARAPDGAVVRSRPDERTAAKPCPCRQRKETIRVRHSDGRGDENATGATGAGQRLGRRATSTERRSGSDPCLDCDSAAVQRTQNAASDAECARSGGPRCASSGPAGTPSASPLSTSGSLSVPLTTLVCSLDGSPESPSRAQTPGRSADTGAAQERLTEEARRGSRSAGQGNAHPQPGGEGPLFDNGSEPAKRRSDADEEEAQAEAECLLVLAAFRRTIKRLMASLQASRREGRKRRRAS